MHIAVESHIEAAPSRVWSVLVDWESQPRWMVDARSVEVIGPAREGVGTRLRCRTAIAAGVEVTDDMEVVAWEPPHLLAVHHDGWLIRGVAAFELAATDHGTHVRWWEEVEPPLGAVGELGAAAVASLVRRLFRRSLAQLKAGAEQRSVRPG